MPNCCVVGCKNRSKSKNYRNNGVTYHIFPKNPTNEEKWISATGRGPNWFPGQSHICSDHFDEKCFLHLYKSRRLFEWAIPTLKVDHIVLSAREIIARVYHYLKKELEVTIGRNQLNCDFSHLRNIRQRTADATGASVRTVTRVLREERARAAPRPAARAAPRRRRARSPHEDPHATITRTIQDYIHTNDEPDLIDLKTILFDKIGYYCSLATLRKIVLDLGYELDESLSKIVMTTWIAVKEEHASDQEDVSEDVKPPFGFSVDAGSRGAPASAAAAAEVLTFRIKSEPAEPDGGPADVVPGVEFEIFEVKQEPDPFS